jgi:GTPase Era involved in 16S rRNA processing
LDLTVSKKKSKQKLKMYGGTNIRVQEPQSRAEALLQTLSQEAAKYEGLKEMAERAIHRLHDYQTQPLFIMIVGSGNFGKSTLINALLGANVAPVARVPKTWKVDIYHASAEERAELTWRSRPGRTNNETVAQAQAICNQIEQEAKEKKRQAKKKGETNTTWQSDLVQVDWYRPCQWQLPSVAVVDTPGFNQLREDTNLSNVYLYGEQGIECQAQEPFEYYYYRADIVLWCFKATQLEGQKSLEMLNKTKTQNKQILGIITHMDQVPRERWDEIQAKANKLFGNYVDKIIPMAAGAKDQALKTQTTAHLRNTIEGLVNTGTQTIKDESVLEFLRTQQSSMVDDHFDPIIRMYVTNLQRADNATATFSQTAQSLRRRTVKEVKKQFEREAAQAIAKLDTYWQQAGNDPKVFSKMVEENAIDMRSLERDWKNQVVGYQNEINLEWDSLFTALKWESVRLGTQNASTFTKAARKKEKKQDDVNFDKKITTKINADEGTGEAVGLGIAAGVLTAAALSNPIGLAAVGIGFLAKAFFAKSGAISKATNAIEEQIKALSKTTVSYLLKTNDAQDKLFTEQVNESLHKHNCTPSEMAKRAYRFDETLYKLGWNSSDFPTSLVPAKIEEFKDIRISSYSLQLSQNNEDFTANWNLRAQEEAKLTPGRTRVLLEEAERAVLQSPVPGLGSPDPAIIEEIESWLKKVEQLWNEKANTSLLFAQANIIAPHWFLNLPLPPQGKADVSEEFLNLKQDLEHEAKQRFDYFAKKMEQDYTRQRNAIIEDANQNLERQRINFVRHIRNQYELGPNAIHQDPLRLESLDEFKNAVRAIWATIVEFSDVIANLALPDHLLLHFRDIPNSPDKLDDSVRDLAKIFWNKSWQDIKKDYQSTFDRAVSKVKAELNQYQQNIQENFNNRFELSLDDNNESQGILFYDTTCEDDVIKLFDEAWSDEVDLVAFLDRPEILEDILNQATGSHSKKKRNKHLNHTQLQLKSSVKSHIRTSYKAALDVALGHANQHYYYICDHLVEKHVKQFSEPPFDEWNLKEVLDSATQAWDEVASNHEPFNQLNLHSTIAPLFFENQTAEKKFTTDLQALRTSLINQITTNNTQTFQALVDKHQLQLDMFLVHQQDLVRDYSQKYKISTNEKKTGNLVTFENTHSLQAVLERMRQDWNENVCLNTFIQHLDIPMGVIAHFLQVPTQDKVPGHLRDLQTNIERDIIATVKKHYENEASLEAKHAAKRYQARVTEITNSHINHFSSEHFQRLPVDSVLDSAKQTWNEIRKTNDILLKLALPTELEKRVFAPQEPTAALDTKLESLRSSWINQLKNKHKKFLNGLIKEHTERYKQQSNKYLSGLKHTHKNRHNTTDRHKLKHSMDKIRQDWQGFKSSTLKKHSSELASFFSDHGSGVANPKYIDAEKRFMAATKKVGKDELKSLLKSIAENRTSHFNSKIKNLVKAWIQNLRHHEKTLLLSQPSPALLECSEDFWTDAETYWSNNSHWSSIDSFFQEDPDWEYLKHEENDRDGIFKPILEASTRVGQGMREKLDKQYNQARESLLTHEKNELALILSNAALEKSNAFLSAPKDYTTPDWDQIVNSGLAERFCIIQSEVGKQQRPNETQQESSETALATSFTTELREAADKLGSVQADNWETSEFPALVKALFLRMNSKLGIDHAADQDRQTYNLLGLIRLAIASTPATHHWEGSFNESTLLWQKMNNHLKSVDELDWPDAQNGLYLVQMMHDAQDWVKTFVRGRINEKIDQFRRMYEIEHIKANQDLRELGTLISKTISDEMFSESEPEYIQQRVLWPFKELHQATSRANDYPVDLRSSRRVLERKKRGNFLKGLLLIPLIAVWLLTAEGRIRPDEILPIFMAFYLGPCLLYNFCLDLKFSKDVYANALTSITNRIEQIWCTEVSRHTNELSWHIKLIHEQETDDNTKE